MEENTSNRRGAITQWWQEIKRSEAERRSLRQCFSPEDAAAISSVRSLQAALPSYDSVALGTIAAVLSAVDVDDSTLGLQPIHYEELCECETYRDVFLLLRRRLDWVGNRADIDTLVDHLLVWIEQIEALTNARH